MREVRNYLIVLGGLGEGSITVTSWQRNAFTDIFLFYFFSKMIIAYYPGIGSKCPYSGEIMQPSASSHLG